jgi:ubiquinone/menaquinone biosynthesis C-methylase UbiE
MSQQEHWEKVYTVNPSEKLGWYKPHLENSLNWIKELNLRTDAAIIDVGGGTSTLVDDLLDQGHRSLTVIDISAKALSLSKERLGEKGDTVNWYEGDITSIPCSKHQFDLWHDRAVFHFLTTPEEQRQYRNNLYTALKPGGHLILATFALEAPDNCAGLQIERYNVKKLQSVLGSEFELKRHEKFPHTTPGGVEQTYLYCHFQKSV